MRVSGTGLYGLGKGQEIYSKIGCKFNDEFGTFTL
jgi:hypothetical protein